MSKNSMQDDRVSFRQESVDNVFSQGGKPFFVQSPPKLSIYTITFFCFMAFIFASSYFIKLPVHINAVGEVIAGKDYHQIVINEDDKVVKSLFVSEGERVSKEQVLLQLDNRDKVNLRTAVHERTLNIQNQRAQMLRHEEYFHVSTQNVKKARIEQTLLVEQLEKELVDETAVLKRYQDNVSKGLTSAILEDDQKRVVSHIQGNLIREKTVFTKLDASQFELLDAYRRQVDQNETEIKRLQLEIQRLQNGLQVLSPCDCLIDNVFIEKGLPIVAGQAILTLSQDRGNSSLMLYVPANQYREIEEGSEIRVNVGSYPSNKYGALTANVVSVSASPIPGQMIRKKGQGLQDTTYFIVKAIIGNVPQNVSLVTGMSVDSDIVIDEVSLFNLIFNLDK